MLSQKACIVSVAKTETQFFMQQRGGGQHNTVGVVQPDVLIQDFQDQKMVLQLYQLFIAMATIITHVATMLGMLPYKYRERSPITMAITQKEWVVVMVCTKHIVNYMFKYNAILNLIQHISHVSG